MHSLSLGVKSTVKDCKYASQLRALEPDVRARIIGCHTQMKTFNFFFGLHLSKRLFAHTDNLSKTLQSRSLSAAAGQRLANLTVVTLQSNRNEASFNAFYDVVLIKVKEYPGIGLSIVPRKRRAPEWYKIGDAEPTYPNTARDHYRKIYLSSGSFNFIHKGAF